MYTNHYNFNKKPFNLTPDPNFLYLTDGHREALASMSYGVKERKGIISITGEVGTGKTTLIYTFLNSLDKNLNTVYIYHTNITFEQILKKILNELNIYSDQTDKTSLLQCFNDYLIEKLANDEIVAIIIDEAQNLGDDVLEELRMLTNLETSKSKLLQLILVGQPELENKLNSDKLRQLKQRIGIKRQLQPLSFNDSKKYIEHRLQVAGYKAKIFNSKALSRICSHAAGIPRTINILCDNALLIGYSKSAKKINLDIINEVINDMEGFIPDQLPFPADKQITSMPFLSKIPSIYYKTTLPILLLVLIIIVINKEFIFKRNPIPENINLKNTPENSSLKPQKFLETKSAPKNIAPPIHLTSGILPVEETTAISPFLTENDNADLDQKSIAGRLAQNQKTHPIKTDPVTSLNFNYDSHNINKSIKLAAKARKGNTLFYFVRKYYNTENITLAYMIIKANPEISDINHIKINQIINIPKITLETPLLKVSDNIYSIELGTFQSLKYARKFYNEPMLSDKEIKIIPRQVSSTDTWYQVILDKFGTKEDSLALVIRLKEKGLLACFNDINLNNKISEQLL